MATRRGEERGGKLHVKYEHCQVHVVKTVRVTFTAAFFLVCPLGADISMHKSARWGQTEYV